MQRACACALLHKGKTIIAHPGNSNDDKAAIDIIQQIGAVVDCTGEHTIEVTHNDNPTIADTIDCHESGLAARLFIPIAALQHKEITVTGSGSLLNRPMTDHIETLPKLQVNIAAENNTLPITVTGPLQPESVTVDGSMSSQFLSGLLITYAFAATEEVTIKATNLNSQPYIDLTLQMLQYFGKNVTNDNYESFTITPSESDDTPDIYINIESDWSAAANFYVAKILGADITIENLNTASLQADKAIANVATDKKEPFEFDATHCPDLIPILSVYAAACTGNSKIKGIQRLVHKESNRIESTTAMLQSLGIAHQLTDDELIVTGGDLKSCTINSYNDHRIVLAGAIAALFTDGPVTIEGAEAVNKSFPAFFDTLIAAGVDCQLVN